MTVDDETPVQGPDANGEAPGETPAPGASTPEPVEGAEAQADSPTSAEAPEPVA